MKISEKILGKLQAGALKLWQAIGTVWFLKSRFKDTVKEPTWQELGFILRGLTQHMMTFSSSTRGGYLETREYPDFPPCCLCPGVFLYSEYNQVSKHKRKQSVQYICGSPGCSVNGPRRQRRYAAHWPT